MSTHPRQGLLVDVQHRGRVLIERHGWRHLYFTGITTESCVAKTPSTPSNSPWIVTDTTSSHVCTEAHEGGLLTTGRNIERRQLIAYNQLPS